MIIPFILDLGTGCRRVAICTLDFQIQLLFETFLIIRTNQRHIFINVKTSSCKVPVILVGF
jgi:hypothetical protein